MGDLGTLVKIAIHRLCRHFWNRNLKQKVVRCLRQDHTNIDITHFERAVFKAPNVGLLFGRFSLGPIFAKSQKMGDLGTLAKFFIIRFCGHY